MVPTTSPANLAAVRTTPGSGLAAQPVSMQFVNSALAAKADDGSVVHLNGSETISGAKTFASAPNVPAPASTGQVANKACRFSGDQCRRGELSVDGWRGDGADHVGGKSFGASTSGTQAIHRCGDLGQSGLDNRTGSSERVGSGNVSTTPAASQNVVQPAGT